MSTVSFPMTLTGSYTDGSVCSAADYRADFEKLRDAVNHMHERFSSFTINGVYSHYQRGAEKFDIARAAGDTSTEYGIMNESSEHSFNGSRQAGRGTTADGDDWITLNIFQVPSWMQGIRVRQISVANLSRLPNKQGYDHNLGDVIDYDGALTFGVATDDTLGDFGLGTQTDVSSVATVTFTDNAEIRSQDAGTAVGAAPALKTNTANRVIAPGEYISISAKGVVVFGGMSFDLNWHFHVTVLCDAMVPVL